MPVIPVTGRDAQNARRLVAGSKSLRNTSAEINKAESLLLFLGRGRLVYRVGHLRDQPREGRLRDRKRCFTALHLTRGVVIVGNLPSCRSSKRLRDLFFSDALGVGVEPVDHDLELLTAFAEV